MAAPTVISDVPVEEALAPGYVSEEEYLRTSYRPNCDYVEGRVEERNGFEFEHSRVQSMLARIFGDHEREWA